MADQGQTLWTIYQKLWFVIIPAKVLGLLPLRIHGNRLTREGLFARMCSIFIMVFLSFINIRDLWMYVRILQLYEMDLIVNLFLLRALNLTANFVVVITDVYREFADAQTGLQIIESLSQYDRRVKQLGLARRDHFLFSWIITLSIILVLFTEINVLVNGTDNIEAIFIASGTMMMKIACHLACLKFTIIVHLLYQRYKHLNDIVLPKDEWRMRGKMADNRRVVNMDDLVFLHSTLTRATKILIKIDCFELLVWIISPIWQFNLGLCYVKSALEYIKNRQTMELGYLCEIHGYSAAAQANKFAMQILRTDPELIRSRDIHEQLDAAIYMNNNKISFRVLNLYDVNFSTLFFIGTMALSLGSVIFDGQHGVYDYKKSHHA